MILTKVGTLTVFPNGSVRLDGYRVDPCGQPLDDGATRRLVVQALEEATERVRAYNARPYTVTAQGVRLTNGPEGSEDNHGQAER